MSKIVYIGGFELPDKNAAAHRVLANAKALRESGHEVVLIGVSRIPRKEYFEVEGFRCYEVTYPSSFFDWVLFILTVRHELRIIADENPDSVIFYNYPALKLLKIRNYLTSKKLKSYADVTEWYESQGFSVASVVKRIDTFFRMRYFHVRLDGLIVISNFLEEYYKRKVKNLVKVPPLIDCLDEKWESKSDRTDEILFVYAGSPGKGNKDRLDFVIKSVKRLIEGSEVSLKLYVVGITEEEYFQNFTGESAQVTDNAFSFLSFKGRVNHQEALAFVKKADYTIFFRENNLTNTAGFPTKFAESISAGTPVITNASSDILDYYKRYPSIGYITEDLSDESLYEILKIASSKSKLERENQKLLCRSLNIFDYRNYKLSLDNIFS